jgi:hypothetical protein
MRLYEDEIRSVEGPRCYTRNRLGAVPKEPPLSEDRQSGHPRSATISYSRRWATRWLVQTGVVTLTGCSPAHAVVRGPRPAALPTDLCLR